MRVSRVGRFKAGQHNGRPASHEVGARRGKDCDTTDLRTARLVLASELPASVLAEQTL
jgi:hypothetical protein